MSNIHAADGMFYGAFYIEEIKSGLNLSQLQVKTAAFGMLVAGKWFVQE